MRDREFVNRFCAFALLPLDDYRGDMDDFLAQTLKYMNSLRQDDLDDLAKRLRTGLSNNFNVFGKHAFRRHIEGQESRSVLNASLWDVMSTGLSRYPEPVVEAHAEALRTAFYSLMNDAGFIKAITIGSNHLQEVRKRFEVAGAMFQEVFGAYSD